MALLLVTAFSLLDGRYMAAMSALKTLSMVFLLSFMAAVSSPDSGVQGSLTRNTARGISNFCNLKRRTSMKHLSIMYNAYFCLIPCELIIWMYSALICSSWHSSSLLKLALSSCNKTKKLNSFLLKSQIIIYLDCQGV